MDAQIATYRACVLHDHAQEEGRAEEAEICFNAYIDAVKADMVSLISLAIAVEVYADLEKRAEVVRREYRQAECDCEVAIYDLILAETCVDGRLAAD